jgi:hypothetical protein
MFQVVNNKFVPQTFAIYEGGLLEIDMWVCMYSCILQRNQQMVSEQFIISYRTLLRYVYMVRIQSKKTLLLCLIFWHS